MRFTRRRILKHASLSLLVLGGSGSAAADTDCSDHRSWNAETAYSGGDRVVFERALWEAKWWTRGNEPDESDAVWIKVGDCDGGGDNEAPTASFTASPTSPAPDESVAFDASGSADADGSIQAYEWVFGDGTTAAGQSITHTYTSSGEYTVVLTVTDDAGATDSSSTTVNVGTDDGGTGPSESVFAPYVHMTTNSETSLVNHYQQAGNDAVTAAFVLSDGNGNAAWDGAADMRVGEAGLASEIQAYQDRGGTVVVSFGGAVGTMIAQDSTDTTEIKREYRSVIDTYGVTHLDFDIESADRAAVDRRNQALAELQSEHDGVNVSYTLRCRTTGLTSHGQYVVENAKSHGVDLGFINVMTMNYGWVPPSASTIEDSANGTHSDLASIFPEKSPAEIWGMIGLTPMIGVNNVGGTHELADARDVASFVQDTGIGLVSFWSLDRDNGGCPDGSVSATCSGIAQDSYEFSEIFNDVHSQ